MNAMKKYLTKQSWGKNIYKCSLSSLNYCNLILQVTLMYCFSPLKITSFCFFPPKSFALVKLA